MICPNCASEDTTCKDSRSVNGYRRRRYACNVCAVTFSTKEVWHDYGIEKVNTSSKPIVKRLEILYNSTKGAFVCVPTIVLQYAMNNILYTQERLADARAKEKEATALAAEAIKCIAEIEEALSLQRYASAILCINVFKRIHK